MHYKNGREAKTGDPVIVKDYQRVIAGTIHSLNAGAQTCNGQVAYPIPGGVNHACVTIGDCFHAEDALAAAQARLDEPSAAAPAS